MDLRLLSLLSMDEMPSSNSDWNMKQAMRSAKLGISASSIRSCSGLSNGTSGLLDTCSRINDNSSSEGLCNTQSCLTFEFTFRAVLMHGKIETDDEDRKTQ